MNCGGLFDPTSKEQKIKEIEEEIASPNFWNRENASDIVSECNQLKEKYLGIKNLKEKITSNLDILVLLKEESDKDLENSLKEELTDISRELEKFHLDLLLSGVYDDCDSILEIHPGAGGTESCDWANMLYRMYTRYCEKKNYKIELIDYQNGEEAGIKSVSMIVHGNKCYGYLKGEKGVHRLIRISP